MQPADREEVKEVTVAAGVKRTAPVETNISFPPGRVVQVEVRVPPGSAGLGGFQLTNSGQQALPYNTGAFFIGDDEVVKREVVGYNNSGRWGFRAFNEDVNAHTFQIRFSVVENDVPIVTAQPQASLGVTGAGELLPSGPVGTQPGEGVGSSPGEIPVTTGPGEGTESIPTGPTPELPPEAPPVVEAPPEGEEPPSSAPPLGEFGTGEGAGAEGEPIGLPSLGPESGEPEVGESGPPTVTGEKPQRTTGGAAKGAHGKVVTTTRHVTLAAGGWLPAGARFTRERVDQGQDLITNWRGPIIAPGDGEVLHNLSDRPFPAGFGPKYAVVRIATGPFAGHDWYIGHCTSAVNAGQKFRTGAVLAHADQGNREDGGWAEIGEAPGGVPGPMSNGAKWAHLFGNVTRTVVVKSAPKPAGKKPTPKRKPPPHSKPSPHPTRKAPAPRGGKPAPKRAAAKPGHAAPKPGSAPRPASVAARRPAAAPKRAPAVARTPPRPAPKPAPRAAPAPRPAPPPRPAPRPAPPPPRPAPPPPRPAPRPAPRHR